MQKELNHSQSMLDKINGVLMGTAVGDAIGLPREGLSRLRAVRLFGSPPLKHSFLFGKGMFSDDTEHTCMVTQSLISSSGDIDKFQKSLACKFRLWLLSIPAGIGLATLKSICKLWIGFSPANSGVYSAGNGPAMRSAILGLYAQNNIELLKRLVRASTQITHTDERAEQGAMAIALATHYVSTRTSSEVIPEELFDLLTIHIINPEVSAAINSVRTALKKNLTSEEFTRGLGLSKGISGYIVHTVPVALFCWLKNIYSFRTAIEDVVLMGGDTDTTGAITGALAGATLGVSEIPKDWIDGLQEWPRTVNWLKELSLKLNAVMLDKTINKQLSLFWPALLLRNLLFTFTVLFHGFRRVFPPY